MPGSNGIPGRDGDTGFPGLSGTDGDAGMTLRLNFQCSSTHQYLTRK